MPDLFAVTHGGQHRQHGFNQHAHIPRPVSTDVHGARITAFCVKCSVGEDNRHRFIVFDQGVNGAIVDVGAVVQLMNHPSVLIDDEAELATYNPAVIRFPFLAI